MPGTAIVNHATAVSCDRRRRACSSTAMPSASPSASLSRSLPLSPGVPVPPLAARLGVRDEEAGPGGVGVALGERLEARLSGDAESPLLPPAAHRAVESSVSSLVEPGAHIESKSDGSADEVGGGDT